MKTEAVHSPKTMEHVKQEAVHSSKTMEHVKQRQYIPPKQ
jgi:hypothetical protein